MEKSIKKYNKFIYRFINKENYLKTKMVLLIIVSMAMAIVSEYTIFRKFYPEFISKDRIMLVTIALIFIGTHFIFKLKLMYECIHNNRYKIALIFLIFVMIFKYSGSSMVEYNNKIQPKYDNIEYNEILGKSRDIRGDEWTASTIYILSQAEGENKFEYFSDKLRGTATDMFTLINAPVADILMIGKPFQIGFLLFGNYMGLSFYWYARITAMILGAYELCLILTNKNKKISLCGSIVITFSAAVQWWYCMDTLIWGQIIIVLINKFMNTDKKYAKYLCALGIISSALAYIFVFYPAWQVPFAYVFLSILIWLLIKNFKNGYRFTAHDIAVIIITIICIILLIARWYMLSRDTIISVGNTVYPGDRCETGGNANNLFAYIYNIFFCFKSIPNPCEYSSMLSFYPIPLILGVIYLLRNKKHISFLIPTLFVGVFLVIWCEFGFPELLAKLTLMSNSVASRASIALGTLNIYILIYLMGNIEKEDRLINRKYTYFIAVFITAYIIYQAKKTCIYPYVGMREAIVSGGIFLISIWIILNINNERIKDYTIYVLIFIALITGMMVNPIIKTTDIFYTKPISKKIQEIRQDDPTSIWIAEDYVISNYALANGVRMISSTNVYPNLQLYETILEDKAKEYEYIYNRYHHIQLEIVEDETKVELKSADLVCIKLNYSELEKLNIKYIISTRDLNKKDFNKKFEKIYAEDGLYIFEI